VETSYPDRAYFLISGPMASGKSTVARLLAQRFDRAVHVEGDVFRRSVVAGRQEMTPDVPSEALAQLRLRYRLTAMVGDAYFAEGFTVVAEDVIAGPLLAECVGLVRSRPLRVVVLLPSPEAIATREAARSQAGYRAGSWSVERLHEGFASRTPRIGLWLDTSRQSPEQTVDAIVHAPRSTWLRPESGDRPAPSPERRTT
jgi:predicted kinase